MAKEKKHYRVYLRTTKEEKELLEKKAKENNLTLSKFLIEKGLADDEDLKKRIAFFDNVFLKKRETLIMINMVNLNNRLLLANFNQLITRVNFYSNVNYPTEDTLKQIEELHPQIKKYLEELSLILKKVKEQ